MTRLNAAMEERLRAFAAKLVDQSAARIIVAPNRSAEGYWFGGGNMARDHQGRLHICGRYRNQGDSRSGLAEGERGCELAVFVSENRGMSFEKRLSFTKHDLSQPDRRVVSIEGSALRITPDGVELFVSSEKEGIGYPSPLEPYLKPGCGVWTIDRLAAPTIDDLKKSPVETVFESRDPEYLHLKDPHTYTLQDGSLLVMFCSHPFSWSSSNTSFAWKAGGASHFQPTEHSLFPRGTTWDVAITRGTCLIDVPPVEEFRQRQVTLLFYDGGESLRNLEEHAQGVRRPRGYSCEELGGLAYVLDQNFSHIHRLSRTLPMFLSPYGTGCSRYVDVLGTAEGYFATWQQSQSDFSQPLVMNFVPREELERILTS